MADFNFASLSMFEREAAQNPWAHHNMFLCQYIDAEQYNREMIDRYAFWQQNGVQGADPSKFDPLTQKELVSLRIERKCPIPFSQQFEVSRLLAIEAAKNNPSKHHSIFLCQYVAADDYNRDMIYRYNVWRNEGWPGADPSKFNSLTQPMFERLRNLEDVGGRVGRECPMNEEDYASRDQYFAEQEARATQLAEQAAARDQERIAERFGGEEISVDIAGQQAAPGVAEMLAGRTFTREEGMAQPRFQIQEELYARPGDEAAVATIAAMEKDLEEAKSSSRTLKLLALGAGLTAVTSVAVAGIVFYMSRRKKRRRR